MILDIDFDVFVKESEFHDYGFREAPFFINDMWHIRAITALANPVQPVDITTELTIDHNLMNRVLQFVSRLKRPIVWGVSDSHMNAYHYIEDHVQDYPEKTYKFADGIIHIDRHPDVDEIKDNTIHAGNWLECFVKATKVYWIPQSLSDYYVDKDKVRGKMLIKPITFLTTVRPERITGLYLCRSGAWTPPWLDKDFREFEKKIIDRLGPATYHYPPEPTDREWNMDEIRKNAEQEREVMKRAFEQGTGFKHPEVPK